MDYSPHACSLGNRFVQVGVYGGGSMEEAGSGHEDSSHNILTSDALQVLSSSQVTPGVVNVHADTAIM
jgi:hypothetical protein